MDSLLIPMFTCVDIQLITVEFDPKLLQIPYLVLSMKYGEDFGGRSKSSCQKLTGIGQINAFVMVVVKFFTCVR